MPRGCESVGVERWRAVVPARLLAVLRRGGVVVPPCRQRGGGGGELVARVGCYLRRPRALTMAR